MISKKAYTIQSTDAFLSIDSLESVKGVVIASFLTPHVLLYLKLLFNNIL